MVYVNPSVGLVVIATKKCEKLMLVNGAGTEARYAAAETPERGLGCERRRPGDERPILRVNLRAVEQRVNKTDTILGSCSLSRPGVRSRATADVAAVALRRDVGEVSRDAQHTTHDARSRPTPRRAKWEDWSCLLYTSPSPRDS